MTKVLIVDVHAEMYRDRLQVEFPALRLRSPRPRGERGVRGFGTRR